MGSCDGHQSQLLQGANRPIEQVSFDDTQEFLEHLNDARDGHRYRLPTEAEWEYAARAGDTGESPDSPPLSETAGFGEGRGSLTSSPAEASRRPKTAERPGLYDMRGDVDGWVSDWIASGCLNDDYSKSALVDPQGAATGKYHLTRCGSWFGNATFLRSSTLPVCLHLPARYRVPYCASCSVIAAGRA
jgi:formylglycine-generating enzyme required for sulfatase activity